MKTAFLVSVLALAALSCGDNNKSPIDAAPPDPDGATSSGYHQVEHLARPGINEALLISQDFLAGYNATAPSFAGVPPATLNAVVGEAKTVLKALYLGACLLNGVLGLTPATGVKPAGMMCHAVGPAIFDTVADPTAATLTMASQTAAQAYADNVFAKFIPDVMRIDTAVDSFYLTPCDPGLAPPLLCGGRFLNDDTIDITYNFLLNGAATPIDGAAVYNQVSALTSDGVNFSAVQVENHGSTIPAAATANNRQQAHPNVSTAFPYSAAPL